MRILSAALLVVALCASAQAQTQRRKGAVMSACQTNPLYQDRALGPVLDAAQAERERGITINTSHVEYATTRCAGRGALLDELATSPGLELFVIAELSAESPGDDLKEIQAFAQAAGLPVVATVLPKIDPFMPVSSYIVLDPYAALACDPTAVAAVHALLEHVDQWSPPAPSPSAPLHLWIDDLEVRADGLAVHGLIAQGVARVGDPVELVGFGSKLKSVITGVEMFRKILDRGEAGDSVALLLRGADPRGVRPGMVVAAPGTAQPVTAFKAEVYVLKKEEGGRHTPFHNKYRPQFLAGTGATEGDVEGELRPGATTTITVKLINPIAMDKGLRFAIREGGRTVGAGQVVEIIK